MVQQGIPAVIGASDGEAIWVLGSKYTFKIRGVESGGAYLLFHAEIPVAPGPPPHVHTREDEVFCILSGELTVLAGGIVSKAGPGATIYLPRNEKHTFWNEGPDVAHVAMFSAPAGIEAFFSEIGTPVTDDQAVAPAVTPELIARVYATAPEYGLTLDPLPEN